MCRNSCRILGAQQPPSDRKFTGSKMSALSFVATAKAWSKPWLIIAFMSPLSMQCLKQSFAVILFYPCYPGRNLKKSLPQQGLNTAFEMFQSQHHGWHFHICSQSFQRIHKYLHDAMIPNLLIIKLWKIWKFWAKGAKIKIFVTQKSSEEFFLVVWCPL